MGGFGEGAPAVASAGPSCAAFWRRRGGEDILGDISPRESRAGTGLQAAAVEATGSGAGAQPGWSRNLVKLPRVVRSLRSGTATSAQAKLCANAGVSEA